VTARTRPGRLAPLVVAGAALALLAGGARAAPAPLDARLGADGNRVVAALDLGAAFPPEIERELGNGLTNVVAIYVAVVPQGGGPPASIHGRVLEILYDVWEETYGVTVKDARTPAGAHHVLPDFAALRRFLSGAERLDLGAASALPPGGFRLDARVEVNPVSKEQLQRTREFIAAGTRTGGATRSVLGAMASFLLREPDPGSDVHLFRSRVFGPGEVAAR
jgi:hypothetical protein